jgi:two-component system C4-dicarboxylate transport sensor histidine kinase DctB
MTLTIFVSVIFSNFGYVAMRLEKIDQEKKLSININKKLITTLKSREKVIKDFGRLKAFSVIGGHSASVVHEIMQPLTAMRFGLENLSSYASKEVRNPEVTSRIDSVKETAEKTIKIVQNLRSLMVEQDVQVQAVNLKEQINESLLILGDRLKMSHIKVITKISGRLSNVMADPNQMQHVLLNIINNAVDAIEREKTKNPKKIEINVYPVDNNRNMMLCITDSGKGISNKIKDHLFEWLSSNSGHGMGVGLALTKFFVETWGGSIEAKNAEPTEGKATGLTGATIEVKLVRAH